VYVELLETTSFYQFLVQIDRDLAEQTRQSGCRFCGQRVHSACYARRPRGVPEGIEPGPEFPICYSFCCRAEGCRRRHRAPSVRFLGRKVYLATVVLLVTAMRQGPSPRTVSELSRLFGADRRTLVRWRRWWQAIFPGSDLWRREAGQFTPSVEVGQLPQSLIAAWTTGTVRDQILGVLKFLSPLGTKLFDGQC